MAIVKDAAWFHAHYGLRDFGEDVLRLSKKETPKDKICEVFGPMSSKSGWNFKKKVSPEVAAEIVDLYRKVYDQEEVTNNEITQTFVRALIVESLGRKVNWAAFAAHSASYSDQVATIKVVGRAIESARSWEGDQRRRPLSDVKENIPALPQFVKNESGVIVKVEFGGMGKGRPSTKSFKSANWEESDIQAMKCVLDSRTALLKTLTVSLEESTRKKTEVEAKVRRVCLECGDREMLHAKSILRLSKLKSGEETCLDLLFSLSMEEKTERHHSDQLQACLAEKSELESVMRECEAECGELLSKVSCLEEVLDSMGLQFENMQMGFGVSNYPRPIEADPSLPIHTSCPIMPVLPVVYGMLCTTMLLLLVAILIILGALINLQREKRVVYSLVVMFFSREIGLHLGVFGPQSKQVTLENLSCQ
jgi:hypothetical protein